MGVGRGWKIPTWNVRNRAIFWIIFGILLVQGALGESTNNATDTEAAESEDVEVVSLVKKDKRQAQRGYTDVPLDQGPFDELIASSPAPIAFENDLPTFVDSLSDIADATPPDYNANKYSSNFGSPSEGPTKGPSRFPPGESISATNLPFLSTAGPGPSAAPSSQQTVVIASNNLGPASLNASKPASFFNQNQIPAALSSGVSFLNNGVAFGPVSTGAGLSGPGITPTGPLSDSLALPDNTAAAALNIERRQVELPVTPNEPPPFNGKAIPGEAGLDYPIYGEIPRTQFSCKDHQWPGYYADTQARCQVFWICQKHRMDGFLCPNGTLFNQQVFVCDWWFNVDCSAAPEFYSRNQFVYAGPGIGIDGQPVRGLSLPIAATNRIASVLPPLPPPLRNNALIAPPTGQGSQVQSSNHVARVAPVTARPTDFQSRADSLNNFFKSSQTTGSGQSYQSQLVSRLQSNPNRLHDTVSIVKSTGSPPVIPSKEFKERRFPAASSQITHAHVSGTSRPTIISSYQPQHVETVSIVTTPNPTTRPTTARPPPPPIPKISPTLKPIKGPSPSPFGNVIKLGTTVTFSTSPRPDYGSKSSLLKGVISSTVKPSKSGILKLSNTNLLGSNSQPVVNLNRPSSTPAPNFFSRPVSTEDPNNTVRPPDYSPQRAPDPTPPSTFAAPGYLPSGRPHVHVDNSIFGRENKQQPYFAVSTGRPMSPHGMRSNQFSNVHGQRENIYASSRKDTFIEFPYSPSQQKNKQKLAEQATSKDISGTKAVVTAIPHFYGQRSNVFSGSDSLSYISNNNKRVIIDHTTYPQREGPFVKSIGHGKVVQQTIFPHSAPSGPPPLNLVQQPPPETHFPQHSTPLPRPPPQQYLDSTGPSPSRPTPSLIPPLPQNNIPPQLQISSKPEQRLIVTASPTPQHIPSSTAQYHRELAPSAPAAQFPPLSQNHQFPPPPQNQFPPPPQNQFPPSGHSQFPQSAQSQFPQSAQSQFPQSAQSQFPQSAPSPFPPSPQNQFPQSSQNHPFHAPPQNHQLPPPSEINRFPQSSQNHQFPPPPSSHQSLSSSFTRSDAVTPRDGFTPLNAGSFISIQTTAAPFSQQILKHNSLHSPHEGHRTGGGVVTYSSTGPPPTPQQVIFSSPPTNNHNLPFVSSTAAPRAFDHGQQSQHNVIVSTQQPFINPSTPSYFERQASPTPHPQVTTPYTTPNNFIAAPTQSPFLTTSPGHRQNPYLPHNHGKQKAKNQHRPPPPSTPPPPPPPHPSSSLSASNPVVFPHGGITTTIKYPEGTGKLRLDFSGGGANRKNIVDFIYSASPTSTTPSNYISGSTTPYPSAGDRFTQSVSSTTVRPYHQSSFPPPGSSGRGPGGRYAGAVTNKSNLSSSAIYVDTAAAAESAVTPVTVPSPSSISPSASPLPPVSTSNYGLRLSATAKKRMTGAWQSYFSSKSEQ